MTQRGLTLRLLAALLLLLLTAGVAACASDGHAAVEITPAPVASDASAAAVELEGGSAPLVTAVDPGRPLPGFWSSAPRVSADATIFAPVNTALAAVVMDEASGAVLYEKDAHRALPPASLTKIATAILAAESGRLDELVTVDVDSRVMRGSTVMGLVPGDRFTLRELLHGLMMPSGNDAALAIGRALAGSDAAFVQQMNDLSRRLGLTDTSWANPHGLGGANHYTSAYDLAILSRYYMSFPALRDVVSKRSYTAGVDRPIEMWTLNPLFGYPGVDGLKTGYTRTAGNTLVTSRVKDGHRIFVVILNDRERAGDAWALSQWAFETYRWPGTAVSAAAR
ncbi:MAG: D-alanyl-D-alanine carboxypeptidase [Dehalococcoidia bacterium]|nr:MAG: D-alanyl-D-alanine carboxypeptidase [Dehalococcoidia bacterium]